MVDNAACIVKDVQISRPGKHGHAKARIEAVGIVDGKKRIFVKPGDGRIDVPIILKNNAQVISIEEDEKKVDGVTTKRVHASCMDLESFETIDIEIPEEFWGKVIEGSTILYWDVVGTLLMQRLG